LGFKTSLSWLIRSFEPDILAALPLLEIPILLYSFGLYLNFSSGLLLM
jgi:hypothetical protein